MIHCDILCAVTIPEVITLVLTLDFSVSRGDRGFRRFPQFDSVAGAQLGNINSEPGPTSRRLLRCLTLTSVADPKNAEKNNEVFLES